MKNDLISREAVLGGFNVRKVTEYDESGCGMDYMAVPVSEIEAVPAVDAVEVVRCKDCRFFMEFQPEFAEIEGADGHCYIRMVHSDNEQQFVAVTVADYCSLGKRRL